MKTIIELPTREMLIDLFEYKDGVLLWRAKRGDDRETKRWNSRYAGTAAGNVSGKGYLQVKIGRIAYMVHRVIYVIVHGDVLDKETQVDHIKSKPDENHHLDLRAASHSQNAAYAKQRSDSTCGKGVTFRRGKFEARIQVRGKRIGLGTFNEVEQARSAYAKAAGEHFGEFARLA